MHGGSGLGSRAEEDAFAQCAHCGEGRIVYSGGCPPRAGRCRKVLLAAKKVESVHIICPVQRSRIKTTKREQFNACGAESTYQRTYSGVAFRALSEMPLISCCEKEVIHTKKGPKLPDDWVEAHVLTHVFTGQRASPLRCGARFWMSSGCRPSSM